jgi:ribosomal protein S17
VEKIVGRRAVIKWERIHYIPKYERYYKKFSKIHAHLPSCISANKGDLVRIGECRPLSKIMHFVVLEVKKSA